MSLKKLYPLKFTPIQQPKIWGGDLLHRFLNKEERDEPIGESWEISNVDNNHSVISNGEAKGKTLHELILEEKDRILGDEVYATYGADFPILIKFLDAKVQLSIQVHPNDKWAKELENGRGKTEMWYIMHAEEDANLYLGWKKDLTKEEIEKVLLEGNVEDYLQKFNPKKGDVFYVPATTVHSIGKGVVLAEIQQTSDITYRLFDFNRKEKGEPRDLHIEKGLKVMNPNFIPDLKKEYEPVDNQAVDVVDEEYFCMKFISLTDTIEVETHQNFQIYIGISGTSKFDVDGEITELQKGETLLIPAKMKDFSIQSESAELLCVTT